MERNGKSRPFPTQVELKKANLEAYLVGLLQHAPLLDPGNMKTVSAAESRLHSQSGGMARNGKSSPRQILWPPRSRKGWNRAASARCPARCSKRVWRLGRVPEDFLLTVTSFRR